MQVLVTIIVLVAIAAWALAVQQRLEKLRRQVKAAWKLLEADQSNEAVKAVYNKHVAVYNAALAVFPANLIGPLTGYKPARRF